jgi:hypothetical protein
MPSTTTLRKNALETLRRNLMWWRFGERPEGIAQNIAALNGESAIGLAYSSTQPTPAVVNGTTEIGMIGVDAGNVVNVPGPGMAALAVAAKLGGGSGATTVGGGSGPTTIGGGSGLTTINGQIQGPPMLKTVKYNECLNASVGTTPFFIADQAYIVVAITYVAKTAGTGSVPTATVTHDTGTQAPGAGTSLLTGTFDCTTTANTVVNGTLTATTAALTLATGDRLSVLFAGTLTSLAGVVVTVTMIPATAAQTTAVFFRANGDIATTSFYQANRDETITGVYGIYGTAFASGVTINVMKDTGTTAAGGGTSVLTAAMAGDGTINTLLTPALSATASVLSMAAGDRLSLKFSATTTGALLCVVVSFAPVYNRKEVTWALAPTAQQQVAQCFFIADRAYEVIDASIIYDVKASGAANIAVSIDKGTTVPGGGNIVQTDNTNAGFDLTATARTSYFMTPAPLHLRLLSPGDRLGLNVTGAAQSVADMAITVSLRPNY